jgi:transcription initiation factor TFIID TATA-box-binding protein
MASKKIPQPDFRIENIVASASLDVELDLYAIAMEVDEVEYEPEQFPGAILKLRNPKASLLLFKNGKIICTGGKSEKEVGNAIMRAIKILNPYVQKKKGGIPQPKFKIENIVASASLGVELDLYAIAMEVDEVEYEPEQFPGAILKLLNPKSSLLLFKNGKIICTGGKSEKEVDYGIERAIDILDPYVTAPAKKPKPTKTKPKTVKKKK